jgi:hypothetical protein
LTIRLVAASVKGKAELEMNYQDRFRQHLEALHQEGRYRVFADLKRRCGAYPTADHFAEGGMHDVTVWCSNDYLGMSQNAQVRAAMHEAIEEVGAGSGGTRNISGTTHYHVELEAELADLHGLPGRQGPICAACCCLTVNELLCTPCWTRSTIDPSSRRNSGRPPTRNFLNVGFGS